MSYQQVSDILNHVQDYHRRFCDALAQVQHDTADVRVAWIASAMPEHEQHWQAALAEYGQEAVLNTWIQFVPDEPVRHQLAQIVITPDMSLDDLFDMVARFRNAMIDLYSTLSTAVPVPRVQELFVQLRDHEENAMRHDGWSMRHPD